jgi:glutamine amidotransferase
VRVAIFDYGAGNLHSLAKAIAVAGVEPVIEADPVRAADSDALILPGVGAFGPASDRLAPGRDQIRTALRAGLPCLGICLGLQLLLDDSEEGPGEGLGVIPGRVTRLSAPRLPQIGWNSLEAVTDPLLEAARLEQAYYANSYVGRPADSAAVVGWSEYQGDRFPAAVRSGRTLGVQFHPEKSSAPGVALIRLFLEEAGR